MLRSAPTIRLVVNDHPTVSVLLAKNEVAGVGVSKADRRDFQQALEHAARWVPTPSSSTPYDAPTDLADIGVRVVGGDRRSR